MIPHISFYVHFKTIFLALLPRGYTPAPRETEADHNGDVRTLERRLKTRVFLTVKDKFENISNNNKEATTSSSSQWQFPTVDLKDGETLLDAAKRALKDKLGSSDIIKLYCPSNCPIGVDMDTFPVDVRNEKKVYGNKTFFMKVQYDDGKVDPDLLEVEDFAWLERSEIVDRIKEVRGEDKAKLYHYLL